MVEPQPDGAPESDRESAYELLQRGQALIKRRHHAQAAIVLERAARLEPGKGSILEPLGRAYHHAGQFELARETFEALLEVDPSAHWAHFALATTLRKLDRAAEARTHLRLAIALSPGTHMYRQALERLDEASPPA
jgi:tetratricopeptide (TPR) repeat protein